MKKRAVTLLTLFAVSINLMACGGKDAQESSADTSTEQVIAETTEQAETESEEEVLPEGKYRSELTNELIDDSLKDQRPIAVMVDNESIALPHYGLSHADVVYEMMNSTMNGRITRFMALFKDYESVDQIGSIRSVRRILFWQQNGMRLFVMMEDHSILMNIWQSRVPTISVGHFPV